MKIILDNLVREYIRKRDVNIITIDIVDQIALNG
jgi:hypothetical protein